MSSRVYGTELELAHIARLSAIVFDGSRLRIVCATDLPPVHDDNAIFEIKNIRVIITIMRRKKYRPHNVPPINQSIDFMPDHQSLAISPHTYTNHDPTIAIPASDRSGSWNRDPRLHTFVAIRHPNKIHLSLC